MHPHAPAAEQQQLRGQRTADSSRLAAPPLLDAFARLMGALLPQARLEADASAAEGAGEWVDGKVANCPHTTHTIVSGSMGCIAAHGLIERARGPLLQASQRSAGCCSTCLPR